MTDTGNTISDSSWVDISRQFAKEQMETDTSITQEASTVSQGTRVDAYSGEFTSQYEAMFQLNRGKLPWGEFFPPKDFVMLRNRLYTHYLIPSIGSQAELEDLHQRVLSSIDAIKTLEPEGAHKGSRFLTEWNSKEFKEKAEDEANKVNNMLTQVKDLNKMIVEINSRRAQYKKS